MRFHLLPSVFAVLAMLTVGEAQAHSKLRSSIPANNATVTGSFGEARLEFIEPIEAAMSYLTVIGADEAALLRVEGADACKDKTCKFAIEPLKEGKYRIDYHILSADGHVVEGKIRFTVKAAQ